MEQDKRSAPRISYPCEIECSGMSAGVLRPRLADISATGAFLDAMTILPSGSILDLKFTLGERPYQVRAEVRNPMPSIGMGVRFLDLTTDEATALRAFVAARNA